MANCKKGTHTRENMIFISGNAYGCIWQCGKCGEFEVLATKAQEKRSLLIAK
ncbi:hypothetical protein LCGC14_2447580 [marine sediment metagenome]|uniref:Uncharacterized protein n=1 Tax=marine sediment metagenome TaxID=412755 RepID=A0A0F9BHA4_9ZZZZ